MWDEITIPFPKFNGCTVEVWEWISTFTPHFLMDVITYPAWDLSQTMLVNGPGPQVVKAAPGVCCNIHVTYAIETHPKLHFHWSLTSITVVNDRISYGQRRFREISVKYKFCHKQTTVDYLKVGKRPYQAMYLCWNKLVSYIYHLPSTCPDCSLVNISQYQWYIYIYMYVYIYWNID